MFQSHSDMVQKLAKPGSEIIQELTAEYAHLWHMATGVAGEAGELLAAVVNVSLESRDVQNIFEELGDLEFYLEGIRAALTIDFDSEISPRTREVSSTSSSIVYTAIVISSCEILDAVKKAAIYNKKLNREKIVEEMVFLEHYFSLVRDFYGWSRYDVLTENIRKLSSRYSSGSYSNQQAQDRADKVVG